MRFSQAYDLPRNQSYLDFIDVPLDTDLQAFVEPSALHALNSNWAHECTSLIQHYFERLLQELRSGNRDSAIRMVADLGEGNEFCLGYSTEEPAGHGFGSQTGEWVVDAILGSIAMESGLLTDLEDTSLLIDGIGPDMVSDAICNIIRGPLIRYTHAACQFYGVKLIQNVDSGPIWDIQSNRWTRQFVSLPIYNGKKIILIPKRICRFQPSYVADRYYRHFVLPRMQQHEIRRNSPLVKVLKDGTPKVTKVDLIEKYGATKLSIVEQTTLHPAALSDFREFAKSTAKAPTNHIDVAREESDLPDWDNLLAELAATPPGRKAAHEYERVIEKLFSALFYPELQFPEKQNRIHNGRKIIDITYNNEANSGFFFWAATHYICPKIMIECKNYSEDIGNAEFDQLAGRFSNIRGRVGLLVCREFDNKQRALARAKDTATDGRGYILAIDDKDLSQLVLEKKDNSNSARYSVLRSQFSSLLT